MRHPAAVLRLAGAAVGAVALTLAVGCGGGGASGPAALPPTGGSRPGAAQSVGMVIHVPAPPSSSAIARRPAYVSPNTASIEVTVTPAPVAATPTVVNVTTGASPCPSAAPPGSGYVCTIVVQALPGSDTFTVTAYASPNAAGSVLSQGTISANIGAAPSPTPLTVTLGGVVNSIALTL
ncbi:MAG: hypothetical protein ACYDFS_11415, partial [Vulcanimicrobiaceae bacterium]